jgi:transposase
MSNTKSDEFKADAVRIALTSGLTRREVSSDLGIGLSTLNKWIQQLGKDQVVCAADADLVQENERLRRENRVLKEEREVLKKATAFFARQKT